MSKLVFVTNTTAAITETTYDGKPYLLAPVVAIKEGVLNGYLYLTDEISAFVGSWSGRPISLGHPKRAGEYVSANTPDIWATEVLGHFWNVFAEKDALKGEIWLDLEKAEKIGDPALNVVERLRAGEGIEVSTGLWFDLEETPGIWNGIPYEGIARNIRPDHLALLPNEIGACSWDDGCGVPRVNEKGAGMGEKVTANELTLDDKSTLVRRAFWSSPISIVAEDEWNDWDVISVFDATLIAKNWQKKSHMAFPFTMSDSGEVTFGEAVAVEVVYRAKEGGAEVVIANSGKEAQGLFARFRRWVAAGGVEGVRAGELPASNGVETPVTNQEESDVSKCDLVAAIVANKQNKFSKEALDKWSEADLETLRQSLTVEATPAAAPVTNQAAPAPAVNQGIDTAQLSETIRAVVNETIAPVMATITANADRERAELVTEIVANSTFEADDLKGMTVAQLQKMAESLQPRDYSGGGGIFRNSEREDEEYVMAMPDAWVVAGEGK